MSSSILVLGKLFDFSLVAKTSAQADLYTSFCMIAWKLKTQGKKKIKGVTLNSFFIWKCNYKAFNRLLCPNRLTLWNHAQISKWSKFFQSQGAGERILCSSGEKQQREEGEKTPNRLWRSLRSFLTTLQLCTCAVGEHKKVLQQSSGECGQLLQDIHSSTDTNTLKELWKQNFFLCALYKNILFFL